MKFYNSVSNFSKESDSGNIYLYCENNNMESIEESFELNPSLGLEIISEEEIGFFVLLYTEKKSQINLGRSKDIGWWGLDRNYRFDITPSSPNINVNTNFIGFVVDDDKIEKADILLDNKSLISDSGQVLIYVTIKHSYPMNMIENNNSTDIKTQVKNNFYLNINLYRSNAYDIEDIVESSIFNISVINLKLEKHDDYFFMDLWQHPSSWARQANMSYYSDEHFELIEKYLKGMKKLGQKVIDLIVSDFPWGGQMCFDVKDNPSRLYEYNIVSVKKKGEVYYFDYKKLDRYIDLCVKIGIDKEINLFGILGNWHGYDFGSPLKDYSDPIRIRFYDIDKGVYDYMRKKEDLSIYISSLFEHLNDLGVIDITYVIGDEPSNIDKFNSYSNFLESSTSHTIKYKYALHSTGFFEDYDKDLESFSINTFNLAEYCKDGKLVGKVGENSYKMTWYSCCIPQTFNIFIKSPLIESMLTGFYTYIWQMKGMLRWAYGIYVENPISDIRYKPSKWSAGDMLYVYPNKGMNPLSSLREKNTLYGVQDYNIFKKIEKEIPNLYERLKDDFDIKINIGKNSTGTTLPDSPIDGDIILDKYPYYQKYRDIRNKYIKEYVKKESM